MRIVSTLFILVTFLFISCEGSTGIPGPPGVPGPPGEDGLDGIIGQVFEAQVDFNKSNGYEFLVEIPSDIEVYDSDIIMCYILVGDDNWVDIWEPLPQTLFFGDDILLYGFDHTQFDVNFFMDGTVDFGGLDSFYTDGLIFRIAIIPADYAKSIDVNKMETVIMALKVEDIKRIN
jgi:hypothetical protein